MWRCEDVKMRRCEKMWEDVRRCEKMWRCEDVKMRRCEKMWEDVKMRRWEEDGRMRRCEDEKMWRWEEDVKMRRCEDERMWRWEDVKMRGCEDERMWRWEDVKMRRCEDERMWRWEDVKMRRCEDEKMWRWEDVLQTPTIGRTLRSDALGKKDDFEALFKSIMKRKITSAKMKKICWQITIVAWMQPLQYDLWCSAAKDNSITHAAAAPSNVDAATTMRSADTELQNTIELRATVSEIAAPKPDVNAKAKKTILKHFLKGFLKGKFLPWKLRKSTRKSLSQPGCSHSNTIYDVQLQETIVLRMQPRHRATLTQPLQCDLQTLSCKTQ